MMHVSECPNMHFHLWFSVRIMHQYLSVFLFYCTISFGAYETAKL